MNENDPAIEEFANNMLKGLVASVGYSTVITQLAALQRNDAVDAERDGENTSEYQNHCDQVSDALEVAANLVREDAESLHDLMTQ